MKAPEERLRHLLATNGVRWMAPVEYFDTIGSTNDHLKQRVREGAAEWTVVVAGRQTAGRGRQGHAWVSPPGNLFLSVALRPPASAPWTLIPLAAGVALAEALAEQGLDARLKWPNDVMIGGRKVAGILVESSSGSRGLESAVVGIGVNVAVSPGAFDGGLRDSTTSVREHLEADADALALAAAVLVRLTVWYPALARDGARALVEAWRQRSLPWWGRAVEARREDAVVRGIARDVDEAGALVLELPDGKWTALHSGEVREVRGEE